MGLLDYDGKTLVGKVLKVGVYPTFELVLQSDYFEPPEFLLMGVWVYTRVPEFLALHILSGGHRRKACASQWIVSSGGFHGTTGRAAIIMASFEQRQPSGQRRLGPAFVMDAQLQACKLNCELSRATHRDDPLVSD